MYVSKDEWEPESADQSEGGESSEASESSESVASESGSPDSGHGEELTQLLDMSASGMFEKTAATPQSLSVIGETLVFKGDLTAEEDLLIQGNVSGSIVHRAQNLTIGASGNVRADITAQHVIIQGKVRGDVRASESIIVAASARVEGNLYAPTIGLKEGAKFKGSIDMDPGAWEQPPKPAASAPQQSQSSSQSQSQASAESQSQASTESQSQASAESQSASQPSGQSASQPRSQSKRSSTGSSSRKKSAERKAAKAARAAESSAEPARELSDANVDDLLE